MSETILIKKSESTAALEATGTTVEMIVIKTGTAAQEATAMSILSGISDKSWMSSDTIEVVNGEMTTDIQIPKKVAEG